ncbi:hypothetical protein [Halorubrum distributum]|uniref:hypothetical protein n=1 Tax=Halorubrum distributum TaxID=29283 RepID=UPI00126955B7|nr:hypothetical protein [Halorubrum terrestre]
MFATIISENSQYIVGAITGVLSAILGATAIVTVRHIYQKRKLLAAIHAELWNNLTAASQQIEGDFDAFERFNISNEAWQAARTNDPSMYVDISKNTTFVGKHYLLHDRFYKTYEIAIDPQFDTKEDGDLEEAWKKYHNLALKSVRDIESYKEKDCINKILFYSALDFSHTDSDYELYSVE